MIAYKEEAILELYAKNKSDKIYKKICEYNIAEKSGALGPKRKEGDLQVPEGFYNIEIFNPASSYYLSLGINKYAKFCWKSNKYTCCKSTNNCCKCK